jgi:RNA polymerase sigma-70 factor (family 1)
MTLFEDNSFEHFYLEVFPQVRTFLFSKCQDYEIAEDITQEAFIRLWHHRTKIDILKARSFTFTVANNLFLDHVRHQKVVNTFIKVQYISDRDIKDPQYLIEVNEFHHKLNETIQSMPPSIREAFLLNRYEKMTYQQIADSLDISVKTIEKRMQKALEILALLKMPKL